MSLEKKLKLLWVAPNLNHYKQHLLQELNRSAAIDLKVVAGISSRAAGHKASRSTEELPVEQLAVKRAVFGYAWPVFKYLWKYKDQYDILLLPIEKKNAPIIVFAYLVWKLMGGKQLISYNHPLLTSNSSIMGRVNAYLTKLFYRLYDKVIFYTKEAKNWAIDQQLIQPLKAFYANNTLGTQRIQQIYTFSVASLDTPTILYIGRLIPAKGIRSLVSYFEALGSHLPAVNLLIVGDGPEAAFVEEKANHSPAISWLGAIVEEEKLMPLFTKANLVFVPGDSGLSINHAFAYGKPYITLTGAKHGPEISYLKDGENGFLLNGTHESNVSKLVDLLLDKKRYEQMCQCAFSVGQQLSTENWVDQMEKAILA